MTAAPNSGDPASALWILLLCALGADFHVLDLVPEHDTAPERWNLYGQLTAIVSRKLPFTAPYTNANGSNHSLLPEGETSFTTTLTLFGGVRPWPGAELYWVPEVIASRPLSNLAGLGGAIQNFELQKTGGPRPTLYSSRLYLRQNFDFGDAAAPIASGPMALAQVPTTRRLALIFGNFSVLDFFDRNSYASDLRRQFFNMAFLTHAAWDFAADARGYAWGGIILYRQEHWEVRLARLTPPKLPNQLPLDFRIWQAYGDQIEVEHQHLLLGDPGAVRLLAYRNHETVGAFADATAALQRDPGRNAAACNAFNYGSQNGQAPDLCWVRRPQAKWGVGVNLEQQLDTDGGLFARAMLSDGRTEVYSYTATDASVSLGLLWTGARWRRDGDALGLAYAQAWIGTEHAAYLGRGGVDGFIGDGALQQACEHVLELFYSAQIFGPTWLSGDYQLIVHPAYNAARGPVHIFGVRFHAEG